MQGAVRLERKPRSSQAGRFVALGKVKVPRAENMGADSNMSQIGMVAHKGSFARRIRHGAYFDAAVSLTMDPVAEGQFEIC